MQSCCLLIRLRHTYPFLFENGNFFLRLSLPSTLTNPVKTVTENASFQKRSPVWRFLKTSAFLLGVDGRKRFRIRNTMMSYIIYFQHNACSIIKLWFPIVFAFSCGLATTIRICYVWLRICLKMEVKISVIKNIRIHVDGAKPIAFLPLSSLVRLPNYCLTNLFASMLISRFLVSSLFSFLLYFRKRVHWI